jgi:DNA-binding transcriptional LysR family regulator
VKSGHGIAALPSWIGVRQSDLMECFEVPNSNFGIYLITRESLKNVPCVKAFIKFIMARTPALRLALEGPHVGKGSLAAAESSAL